MFFLYIYLFSFGLLFLFIRILGFRDDCVCRRMRWLRWNWKSVVLRISNQRPLPAPLYPKAVAVQFSSPQGHVARFQHHLLIGTNHSTSSIEFVFSYIWCFSKFEINLIFVINHLWKCIIDFLIKFLYSVYWGCSVTILIGCYPFSKIIWLTTLVMWTWSYRRATGPIRRAKGGWTAQEVSIQYYTKFCILLWSRFSYDPVCEKAYESVRSMHSSCYLICIYFSRCMVTNFVCVIHVDW